MDDTTIEELTRREVAIESTFNSFRAELNGKKVTENEIKQILSPVLRTRACAARPGRPASRSVRRWRSR